MKDASFLKRGIAIMRLMYGLVGRILALAGALTCLSTAAHAASQCGTVAGNLVANCGFEANDITGINPDSPRVGGWSHESTGVGAGIGPGALAAGGRDVGGLTHSGDNSYNAFFQNVPTILVPKLEQGIPTIIGHTYRVGWFENLVGPADSTAIVFAQINAPIGTVTGGANLGIQTLSLGSFARGYHQISADFVADQTLSVLEFSVLAFRPGHPVGADVVFNLDDVSMVDVTAAGSVPEPAAWALMIAGFGLAGAGLRRRTRIVAAA